MPRIHEFAAVDWELSSQALFLVFPQPKCNAVVFLENSPQDLKFGEKRRESVLVSLLQGTQHWWSISFWSPLHMFYWNRIIIQI